MRPCATQLRLHQGKAGLVRVLLASTWLFRWQGARLGLFDADIYGPNIPLMMGVKHLPATVNQRIMRSRDISVMLY
jgi:Mrp family chromosome partitioning ATPase